jgi:ribonuclease P protein component
MREEDVPAEQPQTQEDPRFPGPHADARRARSDPPPPQQGPLRPLRLIWHVRDPATFRALARSPRRRSGVLEVSAVTLRAADQPPRVAFAVSRRVGNAVTRNRVRRRLRGAVREHADVLRPGRAYLVTARTPAAASASYRALADAVRTAATELDHTGGPR